jgi:hypothetical protein
MIVPIQKALGLRAPTKSRKITDAWGNIAVMVNCSNQKNAISHEASEFDHPPFTSPHLLQPPLPYNRRIMNPYEKGYVKPNCHQIRSFRKIRSGHQRQSRPLTG